MKKRVVTADERLVALQGIQNKDVRLFINRVWGRPWGYTGEASSSTGRTVIQCQRNYKHPTLKKIGWLVWEVPERPKREKGYATIKSEPGLSEDYVGLPYTYNNFEKFKKKYMYAEIMDVPGRGPRGRCLFIEAPPWCRTKAEAMLVPRTALPTPAPKFNECLYPLDQVLSLRAISIAVGMSPKLVLSKVAEKKFPKWDDANPPVSGRVARVWIWETVVEWARVERKQAQKKASPPPPPNTFLTW